jgi:hypothetical protein
MPKSEVVRARLRLAIKSQRREDEAGKGPQQWRRAEPWKVDAVREVNRIGVNINQLTHRINRIGDVPEAAILRGIAAELKAALSRLV